MKDVIHIKIHKYVFYVEWIKKIWIKKDPL